MGWASSSAAMAFGLVLNTYQIRVLKEKQGKAFMHENSIRLATSDTEIKMIKLVDIRIKRKINMIYLQEAISDNSYRSI